LSGGQDKSRRGERAILKGKWVRQEELRHHIPAALFLSGGPGRVQNTPKDV
jgi:hypothetical protein